MVSGQTSLQFAFEQHFGNAPQAWSQEGPASPYTMSWHFTPQGIDFLEANTANLNVQYGTFPITGVFTFSQGPTQDREMKLTYNQNIGLSSNPYSYGESPTSPMTMAVMIQAVKGWLMFETLSQQWTATWSDSQTFPITFDMTQAYGTQTIVYHMSENMAPMPYGRVRITADVCVHADTDGRRLARVYEHELRRGLGQ